MPDLWNAYGFRWGGDYLTLGGSYADAMHYEFMGSLGDCTRLTQVARTNRLGEIRKPALSTTFPGTVKMGSRGDVVKTWQRQLVRVGYRIEVDGVFGPATNHVVIDFQKKHSLAADGIAGPMTWRKIISV
jgi:peptidoglycan hydrolase-like protein with peptidoglycan-binding domain